MSAIVTLDILARFVVTTLTFEDCFFYIDDLSFGRELKGGY